MISRTKEDDFIYFYPIFLYFFSFDVVTHTLTLHVNEYLVHFIEANQNILEVEDSNLFLFFGQKRRYKSGENET